MDVEKLKTKSIADVLKRYDSRKVASKLRDRIEQIIIADRKARKGKQDGQVGK